MAATAAATTVGELFLAAVAEYEHEPALRTPDDAVSWTWANTAARQQPPRAR
jgi:hypothetical protein